MRAAVLQSFIGLLACIGVAEAATDAAAVIPNPALIARVQGIDDEKHQRSLPIADLKMDVDMVGSLARATLEIHFANPTGETLEGELSLALPESAIVTGYALDIEDRFIEGVLAEPSHARPVYERRVRKGVDPGLAEISRNNVFSTRVYPINEDGRTIRVTFVAPVHSLNGWVLPLVTAEPVGQVALTVRAEAVAAPPGLKLPAKLQGQWRQEGDALVMQVSAADKLLSGELRLEPPVLVLPLLITTHPNGRRFFQLSDRVGADSAARDSVARVRVYWDRSRSRQDDALEAEIDLLIRYLEAVQPGAIDVVLFNSSAVTIETFANAAAVQARLRRVRYQGATSYATLQAARVAKAETCLLFSDGIGTIDSRSGFKPHCEAFAVTSASDADIGYLAAATGRSTAEVLRLNRDSAGDVLARLRYRTPAILDVRDASGAPLSFVSMPLPRGHLAAVGEAPSRGDIVVRIGGSGAQIVERRYRQVPARRFEGAGALWAADQILQLAAMERMKELRGVSQRFSVASPYMAFVVLEGPSDYVEARIDPPASYPQELRDEYDEIKAEDDEQRRSERKQHLAGVIERWQDQKHWWNGEFDSMQRSFGGASERSLLEDVVVTGSRAPESSGVTIELAPWNIARPYLKALDAAGDASLDSVLEAEEKTYGELPAFYLDVAEWFHRRGELARAEETLLSALELPSKNTETLSIVADRMARYGQLDRAVWLYEELVKLTPDRPQPLRALALALAERAKRGSVKAAAGDLTRALALLNQVVTTPWDEAYEGIELIALMEANAFIPRLKALGVRQTILDRRLVARLDVDLRVTIEWNTAATDLDLWVTEPSGERAIYSNPLTAMGGRLSNDMTAGFGPEEYLLRRAPDGRFQVAADVFAADPLDPNGPSIVTARLTHNFGRADERTEVMDLELQPDAEGAIPIGTLVLGNQGAGFNANAAPLAR